MDDKEQAHHFRVDVRLGLPSPSLNPNNSKGRHWSVASSARSAARLEAFVMAKQSLSKSGDATQPRSGGNVRVDISFHFPNSRPRDLDNLMASLKPSIDGIADAVGVNDKDFSPIQISRFHDGGAFVEISLFLNKAE